MSIDNHPPAFCEYPRDNLLDSSIDAMSTLEFGAYNWLKQRAWYETPVATIPTDDQVLARWARLTLEVWLECKAKVLARFKPYGSDRYIEPRLAKEYQKLKEARRKKSAAGKMGADARWPKNGNAIAEPCDCHSDAIATPKQCHGIQPNNPYNPNNPVTQINDKDKTHGGCRGDAATSAIETEPQVFAQHALLGSYIDGLPGDSEIPCDSFNAEQVFKIFRDLFIDNGVVGATDLKHKVRKCRVTPSRWTMLYLDKIQFVYDTDGSHQFYERKQIRSDPVALTISGLRRKQAPTDSACNLFKEIVIDKLKATGQRNNSFERLTGELIATELSKRKYRRQNR